MNKHVHPTHCESRSPWLRLSLLVFAALALSGCVERRILFTSSVQGVDVSIELDGHVIGNTPCEVKFEHYGKREWVARAAGYEIAAGEVDLEAPWYQYAPIDFFAEALVPWTIHDQHRVRVEMRMLNPREDDDLEDRALNHRDEALEALDPVKSPSRFPRSKFEKRAEEAAKANAPASSNAKSGERSE